MNELIPTPITDKSASKLKQALNQRLQSNSPKPEAIFASDGRQLERELAKASERAEMAEKALSECRMTLVEVTSRWASLPDQTKARIANALTTAAGFDYVPRAELDAMRVRLEDYDELKKQLASARRDALLVAARACDDFLTAELAAKELRRLAESSEG